MKIVNFYFYIVKIYFCSYHWSNFIYFVILFLENEENLVNFIILNFVCYLVFSFLYIIFHNFKFISYFHINSMNFFFMLILSSELMTIFI